MTTTEHSVVGKQVGRVEGPEKVTGVGKYGEDIVLPGTLWCKVLRSPYAHARIVRVDASKAQALAGVHAVLTGEDVRGLRTGGTWKDEPILCWDRVLFAGDRVAAVAAEDEDTAQRALDLIEVEYEELPAILSIEDALRPGAPILHPDLATYEGVTGVEAPSNRFAHVFHEKGNVDQGLAQADLVVEGTYFTQRSHQGYLEPHSSLVWVDPRGLVQVWESTQMPLGARTELARLFGLPPEQIVVNFSYIGGSFGGKIGVTGSPLCYVLAKHTGRPVKLVLDYSEELQAMNPRHPMQMHVKMGVKRDGTITAFQAEGYFVTGAYAAYAPVPPYGFRGAFEVAGPYRIPHVRLDCYQVYANTIPCGIMRSPGEFQGIYAGESHVDVVARALGMDPYELRLKNVVREGDEMPDGRRYEAVRLEETLRAAAEASGYFAEKAANVGRGIAIGHRSTIGGDAHVAVSVHADGRIEANLPTFEVGTGTGTVLAQVIAEELGVRPTDVQVVPWSTNQGAFDFGVGGSRGARVYSIAGYEATQDVKGKLRRLAAEFLGWSEESITFQGGDMMNGTGGQRVPMGQVASRAGGPVTGRSDVTEEMRSPYTSFGAHVAEVEVDPETGRIAIRSYTAVHETGEVLNPIGYQGQVEGGIVYGLGQGMIEDLVVAEDGRVANPSLADFKLPNVRDIPPLRVVVLESSSGHGPYKVRGVGEHSNILPAPAIANAVEDAVGIRVPDLPVTAEKVYAALKAKGGTARG